MKHKPKFHMEGEKENKAHQMIKMIADLKLKQDSSGNDEVVIEGYASTIGEDRGKDVVKPTAFDINQAKSVIMLFNHDPYFVIGKTTDARADARGLFVKGRITSNQFEVQDNIKNGNLTKMSIGFIPTEFTFNDAGGMTIEAVDLLEISVVSTPMNEEAEFSVSKQLKAFRNLIQKDMDAKTLEAIHKNDEVEAAPEVEETEAVETTEEEATETTAEATENTEAPTEESTEEVAATEETTEEGCDKTGCTSECTKSTDEEEATEEATEEVAEEVEASTEEEASEEVAEETTEAAEAPAEVETKSVGLAKAMATIEALQKDSAEKSELIMKLVEGINTLTEKLDSVTETVNKIPVNSASKTFGVKTSQFKEAWNEVMEKADSMMSTY